MTLKSLIKHLEQKNLLTEVAAEKNLKVNEPNLKTLPLMNIFRSTKICAPMKKHRKIITVFQ